MTNSELKRLAILEDNFRMLSNILLEINSEFVKIKNSLQAMSTPSYAYEPLATSIPLAEHTPKTCEDCGTWDALAKTAPACKNPDCKYGNSITRSP